VKNEEQAQSAIKNEKLKVKKHAQILLVVKASMCKRSAYK